MWGLKQRDIDLIRNLAQNYPSVEQVIIFGSRAMGNYREGSDVDLALQGPVTPREVREMAGLLNDELPTPYMYDVLALDSLTNQALVHHIQTVGQILYQRERGVFV